LQFSKALGPVGRGPQRHATHYALWGAWRVGVVSPPTSQGQDLGTRTPAFFPSIP
jgi:hypothetical protein